MYYMNDVSLKYCLHLSICLIKSYSNIICHAVILCVVMSNLIVIGKKVVYTQRLSYFLLCFLVMINRQSQIILSVTTYPLCYTEKIVHISVNLRCAFTSGISNTGNRSIMKGKIISIFIFPIFQFNSGKS